MRYIIYLLLSLALVSSCMKEKNWDRHNIKVKLKAIFPNSAKVEVLDSTEYRLVRSDSLQMPPPAYKAIIREKEYEGYSFILFFYNSGIEDTAVFGPVFRALMITDLSAGFGTRKQEHLLAMPAFNKSATKMVAYAIAVGFPDKGHIVEMENKIIAVFDLQKTEYSGNMTDPAKDSKQHRPRANEME
jgi:hypothetical protein